MSCIYSIYLYLFFIHIYPIHVYIIHIYLNASCKEYLLYLHLDHLKGVNVDGYIYMPTMTGAKIIVHNKYDMHQRWVNVLQKKTMITYCWMCFPFSTNVDDLSRKDVEDLCVLRLSMLQFLLKSRPHAAFCFQIC